ncbi:hypothetical protein FGG08_000091 [Glutinoglossum americanum]|uniref:Malate dehydrogenase n=1 Tax=Glutinoglossum americanum TaxID=1670608 RepID=A0A9P8L695_9PEZI|nr:hypothetical protein FGG08_000091 [Glutinoglossum americanum]
MRASIWILGAIALGANAHPHKLEARNNRAWLPAERNYYEAVAESLAIAERNPNFPRATGQCDMSKATMPSSTLPPPDAGLVLKHVAIGRGTQNYTCADNTNGTKPVAIGAVAELYNSSCVAADFPQLLATLPDLALNVKLPQNLPCSGKHYFVAASPFFEITRPSLGSTTAKKLAACSAPAGSPKGKGGNGYGAVPWLKLGQVSGAPALQNVFRVNTAGGNPPPDCKGQPSTIQIPYSAEYVFFVPFHPSAPLTSPADTGSGGAHRDP